MTNTEALAWIADIFEEPPENVKAETARDELAGWDSLGVLSLMAALDEKFDIQLTETGIESLATVGDVLELLRKHNVLEAD